MTQLSDKEHKVQMEAMKTFDEEMPFHLPYFEFIYSGEI